MREPLREVAQGLAAPGRDLLGVETDVVRVGERLLEDRGGVVEAAAAERQILGGPEGADAESALAFGERALVALEERAAQAKLSPDAIERRAHPRRARLRVSVPGEEQEAGVDVGPAEGPRVAPERAVVPELLDLAPDEVAMHGEAIDRRLLEAQFATQMDEAVERRPAHRPRMRVALALAALFPDAVIGLAPRFAHDAAEADEHAPRRAVELAPVLDAVPDRAHQFAVEIELELGPRRVPHPDRSRDP